MAEMTAWRIAVLGPGAVGGLLAGLLSRHGHEVTCIGTPSGVSALSDHGLRVESAFFEAMVARPRAELLLTRQVDAIFITTKAPVLEDALNRISDSTLNGAVVVSLLNGVGHAALIRARLGPRVVVGSIGMVEVRKGEDGVIRHLSRHAPHVDLASDHDVPRERVVHLASMLDAAGIEADVLESEAQVIWRKLVRLDGIASMTAACGRPLGAVRNSPALQAQLEALVFEASRVATREGCPTQAAEVMRQIDALPVGLTTSLQRDLQAGKPSELEAITGAVRRLARLHGIPVPAHDEIYARLSAAQQQG